MNPPMLTAVILGALVIVSALAVVDAQHQSRTLFVELQALEAEAAELETDWGRLQLEQSTWATHGRIERVAREELDMRLPEFDGAEVVVLP